MLSFVVPTRRSLLATVVGLLLLGSGGPLSVMDQRWPQAGSLAFVEAAAELHLPLKPFTPATFRAVVSPADAQGSVTFAANGVALGSVPVAGGQAVVASTSRPAGDYVVTGSFVPTTGTRFLGSSATPVKCPSSLDQGTTRRPRITSIRSLAKWSGKNSKIIVRFIR